MAIGYFFESYCKYTSYILSRNVSKIFFIMMGITIQQRYELYITIRIKLSEIEGNEMFFLIIK